MDEPITLTREQARLALHALEAWKPGDSEDPAEIAALIVYLEVVGDGGDD